MQILQKFEDGDSVNNVYYKHLSNGKVAIKWDLESDYFKIVSKASFDQMCKDAKVVLKDVTTGKAFTL